MELTTTTHSMDISVIWKHVQDVIQPRKNGIFLDDVPRYFRYQASFPLPYEEHNCETPQDFIKQYFTDSLHVSTDEDGRERVRLKEEPVTEPREAPDTQKNPVKEITQNGICSDEVDSPDEVDTGIKGVSSSEQQDESNSREDVSQHPLEIRRTPEDLNSIDSEVAHFMSLSPAVHSDTTSELYFSASPGSNSGRSSLTTSQINNGCEGEHVMNVSVATGPSQVDVEEPSHVSAANASSLFDVEDPAPSPHDALVRDEEAGDIFEQLDRYALNSDLQRQIASSCRRAAAGIATSKVQPVVVPVLEASVGQESASLAAESQPFDDDWSESEDESTYPTMIHNPVQMPKKEEVMEDWDGKHSAVSGIVRSVPSCVAVGNCSGKEAEPRCLTFDELASLKSPLVSYVSLEGQHLFPSEPSEPPAGPDSLPILAEEPRGLHYSPPPLVPVNGASSSLSTNAQMPEVDLPAADENWDEGIPQGLDSETSVRPPAANLRDEKNIIDRDTDDSFAENWDEGLATGYEVNPDALKIDRHGDYVLCFDYNKHQLTPEDLDEMRSKFEPVDRPHAMKRVLRTIYLSFRKKQSALYALKNLRGDFLNLTVAPQSQAQPAVASFTPTRQEKSSSGESSEDEEEDSVSAESTQFRPDENGHYTLSFIQQYAGDQDLSEIWNIFEAHGPVVDLNTQVVTGCSYQQAKRILVSFKKKKYALKALASLGAIFEELQVAEQCQGQERKEDRTATSPTVERSRESPCMRGVKRSSQDRGTPSPVRQPNLQVTPTPSVQRLLARSALLKKQSPDQSPVSSPTPLVNGSESRATETTAASSVVAPTACTPPATVLARRRSPATDSGSDSPSFSSTKPIGKTSPPEMTNSVESSSPSLTVEMLSQALKLAATSPLLQVGVPTGASAAAASSPSPQVPKEDVDDGEKLSANGNHFVHQQRSPVRRVSPELALNEQTQARSALASDGMSASSSDTDGGAVSMTTNAEGNGARPKTHSTNSGCLNEAVTEVDIDVNDVYSDLKANSDGLYVLTYMCLDDPLSAEDLKDMFEDDAELEEIVYVGNIAHIKCCTKEGAIKLLIEFGFSLKLRVAEDCLADSQPVASASRLSWQPSGGISSMPDLEPILDQQIDSDAANFQGWNDYDSDDIDPTVRDPIPDIRDVIEDTDLLNEEEVEVFVGNLPIIATEREIIKLFKDDFPVTGIRIVDQPDSKFAFLTVPSMPHAKYLIEQMNREVFLGSRIIVDLAKSAKQRLASRLVKKAESTIPSTFRLKSVPPSQEVNQSDSSVQSVRPAIERSPAGNPSPGSGPTQQRETQDNTNLYNGYQMPRSRVTPPASSYSPAVKEMTEDQKADFEMKERVRLSLIQEGERRRDAELEKIEAKLREVRFEIKRLKSEEEQLLNRKADLMFRGHLGTIELPQDNYLSDDDEDISANHLPSARNLTNGLRNASARHSPRPNIHRPHRIPDPPSVQNQPAVQYRYNPMGQRQRFGLKQDINTSASNSASVHPDHSAHTSTTRQEFLPLGTQPELVHPLAQKSRPVHTSAVPNFHPLIHTHHENEQKDDNTSSLLHLQADGTRAQTHPVFCPRNHSTECTDAVSQHCQSLMNGVPDDVSRARETVCERFQRELAHSSSPTTVPTNSLPVPTSNCVRLKLPAAMDSRYLKKMMTSCFPKLSENFYEMKKLPKTLDILVIHVEDDHFFWGQCVIPEKAEEQKYFSDMSMELCDVMDIYRVQVDSGPCMATDPGAAAAEDGSGQGAPPADYSVEGFRAWRNEEEVFFIDYGNCAGVSEEGCRELPEEFWELPPQAFPFHYAGGSGNLSQYLHRKITVEVDQHIVWKHIWVVSKISQS